MNNGSSLLRIVSGISKTLNIANQMLPLYKQVKPIIANSNKFISEIKSLNNQKTKNTNNPSPENTYTQIDQPKSLNLPTFFQ